MLIDETPAFWVDISPPLSVPFVRKALERSAAVPLEQVELDAESVSTIPPLIYEHAARILRLKIRIFDTPSLDASISSNYASIRRLHLASTIHDERQDAPILRATSACHPALYRARVLTLQRIALSVTDLASFHSLRHLQLLYDLDADAFSMPFHPFMRMLSQLPSLRALHLQMVLGDVTPLSADVQLPSLNELHLKLSLPDAAVFFEPLRCPRLRRFDVDVGEQTPDDSIARRFLSNVRRLASTIPLPPIVSIHATPLTLSRTTSTIDHFKEEAPKRAYIRLEIEACQRSLAPHLRLIVEGMRLYHLGMMTLDAYSHVDPTGFLVSLDDRAAWEALLTLTPNLVELFIENGGCAVDELPRALASEASGRVLCTNLSLIQFSEGGFYRHQLRPWLACLRSRRAHGHMLETLRFHKWTFPGYDKWVTDFADACTSLEMAMTSEWVYQNDYDSDSEDYWSPGSDTDVWW